MSKLYCFINKLVDQERLLPVRVRAIRECLSFMPPVIMAGLGWITPFQAMIASFSAHSVCMLEVRGTYRLRLGILSLLGIIMGFMSWAGTMAGRDILPAIVLSGLVGMISGYLRQFLKEYGPGIATPAALLLFSAMAAPLDAKAGYGSSIVLASAAGSLWGIGLYVAKWPLDRHYPLRYALGESWMALAGFLDPMGTNHHQKSLQEREALLNQTMIRTQKALDSVAIDDNNNEVRALAHLYHGTRVLGSEIKVLTCHLDVPAIDGSAVTKSIPILAVASILSDSARAMALAIISAKPKHLAAAQNGLYQSKKALRSLEKVIPPAITDLDHRQRVLSSINTLCEWTQEFKTGLHAFASEGRIQVSQIADTKAPLQEDPWQFGLEQPHLRYSLCLGLILILGTSIFIYFKLPHGYWIPFSSLVVLQTDPVHTRSRALHRCMGTLAGCLVVSIFPFLHLSYGLLLTITALLCGSIAFHLKRHYGKGVFIVTLLVVMQTQAMGTVGPDFVLERLGCCVFGSSLAFAAVKILYPDPLSVPV